MPERPKSHRRGARPRATPDPGPKQGQGKPEGEQAEQARARHEEGRDLAEEIRRSVELRRLDFRRSDAAAEHAHHVIDAAVRGEAGITRRLDALLKDVGEMNAEIKRLRGEAAELRQMLSGMQQAAMEQQIIAVESQVTQRRMARERFRESD